MHDKRWDKLWINALVVTCEHGYHLIKQGAIGVKDQKIIWVGKTKDLPGNSQDLSKNIYDAAGLCITPGLIDCHTHLIYAGNRAHEFAMRLEGMSYAELAKQGGGIQSTVNATRAATENELLQQSLKRAKSLLNSGVTTVEIKSGYGLDWQTELKMLKVAQQIENDLPITIRKTFLGAHTIPVEFCTNPDAYVDLICNEMIPEVSHKKLADSVDVFCETIAFDIKQTERIFKSAKQYGLNIKCHAEQLSDSGSVLLALKYNALSVDHLEYIADESIKQLAQSRTVAVLLPGAFYFLREKKLPPVSQFRQYHIPMALASDCNPGTSPITSLLTILNMGCVLFGMTPEEALLGVTRFAAQALGIDESYGTIAVGKMADFVLWDVSHPIELAYYLGNQPARVIVKHGDII